MQNFLATPLDDLSITKSTEDNTPHCVLFGTQISTKPLAQSLSEHVEQLLRAYFDTLGEAEPSNLYDIMLAQLEKPLLTVVLEHTRGNQSRTAQILGLNRGTLRKKMKCHDLM